MEISLTLVFAMTIPMKHHPTSYSLQNITFEELRCISSDFARVVPLIFVLTGLWLDSIQISNGKTIAVCYLTGVYPLITAASASLLPIEMSVVYTRCFFAPSSILLTSLAAASSTFAGSCVLRVPRLGTLHL